jgi:hypothetical protein
MTIQEEIAAIETQIAKASSDIHDWHKAKDEEKYLASYKQAATLELQLESLLHLTCPVIDHYPACIGAHRLNNLSRLVGSSVHATDGAIGHVRAAFFDDQLWTIRYLVVETGSWLFGREVLVSPYSVEYPLETGKQINVTLTRLQVEQCPDIDTHQPVTRQHELDYLRHYAYPQHWGGADMWGIGAYPLLSPDLSDVERQSTETADATSFPSCPDVHLRSSAKVTGYDIQAIDESIGHITDFIFDEQSWTIRYLLVDTRNWWPGGKKVLIATQWVDQIDWEACTVRVQLSRAQVKNSPEYHATSPIPFAYEQALHTAYDRFGYWRVTK